MGTDVNKLKVVSACPWSRPAARELSRFSCLS